MENDTSTPKGLSDMDALMRASLEEQEETTTSVQTDSATIDAQTEATAIQSNQGNLHDPSMDTLYQTFEKENDVPTPVKPETPAVPQTVQIPRETSSKQALSANEVDPTNFKSVDASDLSSVDIMAAINSAVGTGSNGVFRAVALKSGYAFEVEPLRFVEIERLINTVGDTHSEQVKLVKTVYSKIKWFSCGKLSYTDFINCTANDDFDTILYAIYCATYSGINKYPIKCASCSNDNDIEVSSEKLVSNVDNEKLLRVRKILQAAADNRSEESMLPLEMRQRTTLPKSNIIIEYGIPSIADFLAGLARMQAGLTNAKTGKVDTSRSELTSMVDFELSIDYVHVPNHKAPGSFITVKDKTQINGILSKLSNPDGPIFKKAIKANREQFRVDYTIPKFNCSHCGNPSPELALNFEQLLFTEMNQEIED